MGFYNLRPAISHLARSRYAIAADPGIGYLERNRASRKGGQTPYAHSITSTCGLLTRRSAQVRFV